MVYNLYMEDSQIIQNEKGSLKHKQQILYHDVNQKQVIKSTLINASSLFINQLLPIKSDIDSTKDAKKFNEFQPKTSIQKQQSNSSEDEDEIDLHPLSNQVGGHTRLLVSSSL